MPKTASRGSLKTKIIAWSFIPTLISLVAVAWFTFYSYQRVTEDLAMNQDKEVTMLESSKFSQAFITILNRPLMDIFFLHSEIDESNLISNAEQIAASPEVKSVFDGGFALLDSDGNFIFARPENPGLLGQNWSQYAFIHFAHANFGRAGISGVLEQNPAGYPAIGVALAVRSKDTGRIIGTLLFFFNVSATEENMIYRTFSDVLPTSGLQYLVDNQNRIIYHPDPQLIGAVYNGPRPWEEEGIDEDGVGWIKDINQDLVISYGPVIGSPDLWHIVREQSWQNLMAPSLSYRRFLLFLLALGVIIPTLVVSFGVNRITRPIEDLIYAAKSVAGGQFNRRISAETGDELQELAEQFNLMSEKLQESYNTLEQRVEDRTLELSTLNAIANVASQSLDLEEILYDALEKTLEKTIMEVGAAYRVDQSNRSLVLMASHGLSQEQIYQIAHLSLKDHLGFQSLFEDKIKEIDLLSSSDPALKNVMLSSNIRQLVVVPLIAHSQPRGYFLLGTNSERQISSEDLSLLYAIGQQIGIAIENALLYERAEESAVAAERSRLARELHDAVTQTLFSTSLIAEVLPELWKINPEEARKRTAELRQLTRGALAEMRTLLLELRPSALRELSLINLLSQLAEAANGRGRLPVKITTQGSAPIPTEVKLAYYRIAQEALNNIIKHSRASLAIVHLEQQEAAIVMTVKDNGKGFDPTNIRPESMGLAIMRERADAIGAFLDIESQAQNGTTVTVTWQPSTDGIIIETESTQQKEVME